MTATADLMAMDQAEAYARLALGNVVREYPAKQDHVLSRAWNLRGIVAALDPRDARIARLRHMAAVHLSAGLDGIAGADYGGLHWLPTFATLALTALADGERDVAARLDTP